MCTNEFNTFPGESEVVILVAAFIGKAVKLNANVGFFGKRAGQFGETVPDCVSKHVLVGAKQHIHRNSGLQQAHQLWVCDRLQSFEFCAERIQVTVQGPQVAPEAGNMAARALQRARESIDPVILAVNLIS